MTNPELVAFCEQTRDHTERIKDLVSVPTELPASLRESLAMLEDRTARPEVRILVLGPLKSGKSTFMNVIARNPRVSQVSPRPAYPCVVEISDPGDDPAGGDGRAEVSIFYKGGVAQAPMPLEQGMERLNTLLKDYVQAKSDEEPQYERVVQKVRLNVAKGQPPPVGDRPGGARDAEDLGDLQVEICENAVDKCIFDQGVRRCDVNNCLRTDVFCGTLKCLMVASDAYQVRCKVGCA